MENQNFGEIMYQWCKDLFPLNRSLTGDGNVLTLNYLQNLIPELKILSYKSNSSYFDWITPKEWKVKEAYIQDRNGNRVIDWKNNNLHLVGYSIPVDVILTREELFKKIHTIEELPNAIPYKTSYYSKDWGFCISEKQLKNLTDNSYRVVINSSLENGSIVCGEVIYPGKSQSEVLLSTYICHPSMANNELSGPAVLSALLRQIGENKNRYYTYRATFHPETIGAISYIYRHKLQENHKILAAWNFNCMGGPDNFSLLPSKYPNSLPEKITRKAFRNLGINFKLEDFLLRGSDERQYASPEVDIPTVSVMKSMYGKYPEYHTSLDNMSFISPENLASSLDVMCEVIKVMEQNRVYKSNFPCEPFLSKYNLEQGIIAGSLNITFRDILNVHMYCDGNNTKEDLEILCNLSKVTIDKICDVLLEEGIIS